MSQPPRTWSGRTLAVSEVGAARDGPHPAALFAAAASAPHAGEVSGQAELGHLHLPGKAVHHDVPQGQVTVHHLGQHTDSGQTIRPGTLLYVADPGLIQDRF